MISAAATQTVEVSSVAGVSGDGITVLGYTYTEGVEWAIGTTTTTGATSLAAAVNTHPDLTASSSGSTVTITAVAVGVAGNSYPITTTDATYLILGGALFTGGVDVETVRVAGITLSEGTDFTAVASANTTADNIGDAIIANSTLVLLFSTSTSTNVLTITALEAGQNNYSISASTAGFAVSQMNNGVDGAFSVSSDKISKADHGLTTGVSVLLSTTAGTPPGGLSADTTYYAIKLNDNIFQLATSSTNALAGTDIDITGVTGSGTVVLTPPALDIGSAGYKWQGSNDNTNWSDVTTSISSITYAASGNTLWDVGEYNFKYLRMVYTAPDWGALDLDVTLNGVR